MSKRLSVTILLFLLLFGTITASAATTRHDLNSGGFWSSPVEAAPIKFIDFERGAG
jgi:hypothetical protein